MSFTILFILKLSKNNYSFQSFSVGIGIPKSVDVPRLRMAADLVVVRKELESFLSRTQLGPQIVKECQDDVDDDETGAHTSGVVCRYNDGK